MKGLFNSLHLLAALLLATSLFAQKRAPFHVSRIQPGPDGIIRCASMEVDAARRAANPNLGTLEEFEQWLAPRVKEYKRQAAEKSFPVIITIPLVVHVLHNGEPVGTAPNITDAQVISQVQVLNEDFRRILDSRGWNTYPDGADVELEFCLASVDPFGQPTNGVNRVNIGQDGATMDNLETTIKPATIWNPSQYMNMWSVKFVAPDDGLLGYAQFPENSGLEGMPTDPQNASTDGVAIRYLSFGTSDLDDGSFILDAPYDLGRTATHEVGHWVGLRHIWGDGLGCNLGAAPPGCSCQQDDFCEDTPNSDQANYGCPTDKTSPCVVPPSEDMIENYMDYTDDPCMNIFTNEQKARVQAVMANSPRRAELVNSPGCAAPQPFIGFVASSGSAVEGTTCGTKTMNIQVGVTQPPSAPATVSFFASGSATDGADYSISPATLTFPAGSTNSQTLTLTIFEDGVPEADEFASIVIDQVTTTGNAVRALTGYQFLANIQNDDYPPESAGSTSNVLLFAEDFNTLGAGWTINTGGGSAVKWVFGSPPFGWGINFQAYIALADIPGDFPLYNPTAAGSSQIESPSIGAANASSMSLTLTYSSMGEDGYDYGTLYFSKNGGAWTQFGPQLSGQPLPTTLTVPLPAEANYASNLRLAFRWDNDDILGDNPPFSFDNVELRGTSGAPAAVQTAVNTGAGDENTMPPSGTVHFYDPTSGKIMASVKNNGSYDYGCATLEVDRSFPPGSAAVAFWDNNMTHALAAKTFRLTTENSDPPAGNTLTVSLFYTKPEITAWEAATLQSKNNLKMVQVEDAAIAAVTPGNGGSGYSISVQNGSLSNFTATAYKFTATVAGGSAGFGIGVPGNPPGGSQSIVIGGGNSGSHLSPSHPLTLSPLIHSVFPNPATDFIEINFEETTGEEGTSLRISDMLGREFFPPIQLESGWANISTTGLADGMYLVELRQGAAVETKKVMVERK